MKATMRRDAWLVIAGGFIAVLNMPEEAERIKRAVIKQGLNNSGPLTIEFSDEFAGGRAPMADVLRSLAGPIAITIEDEPPPARAPAPGGWREEEK